MSDIQSVDINNIGSSTTLDGGKKTTTVHAIFPPLNVSYVRLFVALCVKATIRFHWQRADSHAFYIL